jgi:hypothetical protein
MKLCIPEISTDRKQAVLRSKYGAKSLWTLSAEDPHRPHPSFFQLISKSS